MSVCALLCFHADITVQTIDFPAKFDTKGLEGSTFAAPRPQRTPRRLARKSPMGARYRHRRASSVGSSSMAMATMAANASFGFGPGTTIGGNHSNGARFPSVAAAASAFYSSQHQQPSTASTVGGGGNYRGTSIDASASVGPVVVESAFGAEVNRRMIKRVVALHREQMSAQLAVCGVIVCLYVCFQCYS